MHWTHFILALVDRLAWPVAVIVVLVVLRKPLALLIPKARKVKFKDVELEFGKELDAVEEKADHAFPERRTNRRSMLLATASTMPNAAVLDAWKSVDAAAESVLLKQDSTLNLHVNERYKLMENLLIEKGVVDVKKGKLFSELRQLRNKVAHATRYQIGPTEAARYVDLCYTLIDHLNQAA